MVDIANGDNRADMTMQDLEKVLKTKILVEQNGVTDIFWTQFCGLQDPENSQVTSEMQAEVNQQMIRDIVADDQEKVRKYMENLDTKRQLRRFLRHGYVVEENETYRMRSLIFEE